MKKTDCEQCVHGSRYYATTAKNCLIRKDWTVENDGSDSDDLVDSVNYWTYFVCKKNTFAITNSCDKFVVKK